MIEEFKIFLMVLSSLFVVVHLINVILTISSEDPKPIKIEKNDRILLYLSVAYVITYIII